METIRVHVSNELARFAFNAVAIHVRGQEFAQRAEGYPHRKRGVEVDLANELDRGPLARLAPVHAVEAR